MFKFQEVFISVSCTIAVFAASAVMAEENGENKVDQKHRDSSVTLSLDRNPDHKASLSLSADFAFSEKPRALLDYQRDSFARSASTDSASSIALGIGADFSEEFFGSLKLHHQTLPGSVYAKGGELSGSYRLGDWKFGLSLKALRYTSDRTLSGRRLRDSGIPERSGRLSVSYRLASDWRFYISGTKYNYGGATPTELSDVLASRPEISSGLLSAVEGFPLRSGSLGVGYHFAEKWSTDLSFARTTYELAPVLTSTSLFIEYEFAESFALGFTATRLKQDGLKTGSVIGLQGTYTW